MTDFTIYFPKTVTNKGTIVTPKSTSEANITVPIGQNNNLDSDKGLVVQKTNAKESTLDNALTRFYGEKYTTASEDEKEKLIVRYFDWLSQEKKGTISQIDQFKLYRDRCNNPEEYKRLSSIIDKLEKDYQFNAAEIVIKNGTKEQKDIGVKTVADDYQNYDKSIQVGVTQLIVDSKNEEAIKIGASHVSELNSDENSTEENNKSEIKNKIKDPRNVITRRLAGISSKIKNPKGQLVAAKIIVGSKDEEAIKLGASQISEFNSEELENGETNQTKAIAIYQKAKIKDEDKIEVGKIIIDQYGDLAENSQVKAHEIMSKSDFSEIVKYAASNIWQFHANNQVAAFEITTQTDSEEAINAAAAKFAKYDKELAQTKIKSIIENTSYSSVKETLAKAEVEAKSNIGESNNKALNVSAESSESEKTTGTTAEKVAKVEELIKNKSNPNIIKEELKNFSEVEIIALLRQNKNPDFIKAVLDSNPSQDILNKIDPEILKELGYKKMLPYISFLAPGAQICIVEQMSMDGNLGLINREKLCGLAKYKYDTLIAKEKNKNSFLSFLNTGNRQVG